MCYNSRQGKLSGGLMKSFIAAAMTFVALILAAIVILDRTGVEPSGNSLGGASIAVAYYVENDVAGDAAKQTAMTMRDILLSLKGAGVNDDDIAWTAVRNDLVRSDSAPERFLSYQSISVSVNDLRLVSRILDGVSKAGANYWMVTYKGSGEQSKAFEGVAHKIALSDANAAANVYQTGSSFGDGSKVADQDARSNFTGAAHRGRGYEDLILQVGSVTVADSLVALPHEIFATRPPRRD